MRMKNDISFIIDGRFIFIEQQSTRCPNMPTRFFFYAASAYQGWIKDKKAVLYAEALVGLPIPKCICFYNGADEKEDQYVLRLSDAFKKGIGIRSESGSEEYLTPDIEVRVTMININYGHNRKLLDACEPLKEYSWFCDAVRKHRETLKNLEKAIDMAFEEMPKDFVIRPFILANRAEVKQMCLTEYDEAEGLHTIAMFHEAEGEARGEARGIKIGEARGEARGIKIGEAQGVEIGSILTLAELAQKGLLAPERAAETAGLTVPEFWKKVEELKGKLS